MDPDDAPPPYCPPSLADRWNSLRLCDLASAELVPGSDRKCQSLLTCSVQRWKLVEAFGM
jgi:hypothetical protein